MPEAGRSLAFRPPLGSRLPHVRPSIGDERRPAAAAIGRIGRLFRSFSGLPGYRSERWGKFEGNPGCHGKYPPTRFSDVRDGLILGDWGRWGLPECLRVDRMDRPIHTPISSPDMGLNSGCFRPFCVPRRRRSVEIFARELAARCTLRSTLPVGNQGYPSIGVAQSRLGGFPRLGIARDGDKTIFRVNSRGVHTSLAAVLFRWRRVSDVESRLVQVRLGTQGGGC